MPTASSYITTTGQSGGDASWSSLSSADGAPDAAAASCEVPDGDDAATIAFSHGATVPAGATIDAVRAVLVLADAASAGSDINTFRVLLNGAACFSGFITPPQGTLAEVTRSNPAQVDAVASDINAGVGTVEFHGVDGDQTLLLDSLQIQVDYTEASTRGKRHSRSCARSCAFSAAKKPTEY